MPDPEAETALDLSVIIVNWNTRALLKQCLESLSEASGALSLEIIVVDNASRDGTPGMVKRDFPGVRLIENSENIGFAFANNQGFKRATPSRYLLLLNTDVVLSPGALQRMTNFLDRNPDAGVAGPALRFPNGRSQLSGGFNPSARTAFHYFLFLSRLAPDIFPGLFVDPAQLSNGRAIELDWVAGTCLMLRRTALRDAGGLDESFFMYAEDAEWCQRIRNSGWRVFLLPGIEIIHLQGGSSLRTSSLWLQALIQLVRSKRGFVEALLFRIFAAIGLGIRALGYLSLSVLMNRSDYYKKAIQMAIYARGALQ